MTRNPLLPALLAAALALPACASGGTRAGEPEAPAPAPAPDAANAAPAVNAPAPAGGNAPAAATGPEFPVPASPTEGDRWFVAFKEKFRSEPYAERRRLRNEKGVSREEVTWGASFAELAGTAHGVAQVFAITLDARGLSVGLLDAEDRVVGQPWVEVAAPFRPGTRWLVEPPNGSPLYCEIEAIEEVETPGGKVRALRVAVRNPTGLPTTMTTWYDAGLRPVRSDIRVFGSRELIEARAALASPTPSPDECRAALEWAAKNLEK